MFRRGLSFLGILLLPACLLPSPEKVRKMNGEDRAAVRAQASADLECPADQLRVDGPPNTLGRITRWHAEGCERAARYQVARGKAVRSASPEPTD